MKNRAIEEYARKQAVYSVIELFHNKFGMEKSEILREIMGQFSLSEEEAENFYNDVY